MTPPPLADELVDQALELEAFTTVEPEHPGLVEVPLAAVNRAARLLRTAADVVTVKDEIGA